MIPIGACSIWALAIFLERMSVLRRSRIVPRPLLERVHDLIQANRWDQAEALCGGSDSPMGEILSAGIRLRRMKTLSVREGIEEAGRLQAIRLRRRIDTLSTLANISTLSGLLGTIAGMIRIFSVISERPIVRPAELAGGISEALYTTAAGLAVAIPCLVAYRYLLSRSRDRVLELEEEAKQWLDRLEEAPSDAVPRS